MAPSAQSNSHPVQHSQTLTPYCTGGHSCHVCEVL
uniref:Uncharacterized protein n=1 Tax=Anguilla anguilla TaxID=7936 RepID=A0A0E9VHD6_ANGAN